jgi:hypothetical protein
MSGDDAGGLACPMCRTWFEPRRSDQAYCSARCNKLGAILEGRRSRRVYRALYHWRLGHQTFGANMRFVCREIAAWIREDRAAQRLPPPPHNHDSDRGHERTPQAVKL